MKDLINSVFGKLTVTEFSHRKNKHYFWKCSCACGNKKIIRYDQMKRGIATSCGCYFLESKTSHGNSYSHCYQRWNSMKQRCLNKKHPQYHRYGGRGIRVCKRWMEFHNFFEDMGHPPLGMSLDRIDNNGNYEPSNCRWVSMKIQENNRSDTIYFHDIPLKIYCESNNISYGRTMSRIAKGWALEEAVLTPKMKNYPR